LAGNVGLISQSGGVAIALGADVRRVGFSRVGSSGNEAGVVAADYLDWLAEDAHTKIIGCFIETVREPERFAAALDRAWHAGKPVVALKVGRDPRTRRAVASHTGGPAGEAREFSALLDAHHAIEVGDLGEFTELLAAF